MKRLLLIFCALAWCFHPADARADIAPDPSLCIPSNLEQSGTDCQDCSDADLGTTTSTATGSTTTTTSSSYTTCAAKYSATNYSYQCQRTDGTKIVQVWCDGPTQWGSGGGDDDDDDDDDDAGCAIGAPTGALSLSGLLLIGLATVLWWRRKR